MKTLLGILWRIYQRKKEADDIDGFLRENIGRIDCGLLNKSPSKELYRRYKMAKGGHNTFVWYVLEKYFNDNAVK